MRKSIDIRDEVTILKLQAVQLKLELSAPQVVDRALDSLILSLTENSENQSKISTFITLPPDVNSKV
ncbi:MAG: hypothetical protein RL348_1769, partial [Bacteroidota bacterium]